MTEFPTAEKMEKHVFLTVSPASIEVTARIIVPDFATAHAASNTLSTTPMGTFDLYRVSP